MQINIRIRTLILLKSAVYFTGFRIAQNASGDYLSARREQLNQIVAGHVLRQTSDIQVSAFDTVTAWPRQRHLATTTTLTERKLKEKKTFTSRNGIDNTETHRRRQDQKFKAFSLTLFS